MDTLSVQERSQRMARIRSKNTSPELRVRKLVHSLGFRFRLHHKALPGKPDLVFSGRRKIIFVHGCFWHRHPRNTCKLARVPKSNLGFWLPKLEGNRKRDLAAIAKLRRAGWKVLVVWECESVKNEQLGNKIRTFLEAP